MRSPDEVVFLFDVDNTLLDNDRLTTVWPRQGHYALDPKAIATYPPANLTIERIGDLINYDLPALQHEDWCVSPVKSGPTT